MDPLVRMKEAHLKGLIPDDVYDLVVKRFPITVEGINRIEKASGIRYPTAYVEPSIVVSSPNPNSYEFEQSSIFKHSLRFKQSSFISIYTFKEIPSDFI